VLKENVPVAWCPLNFDVASVVGIAENTRESLPVTLLYGNWITFESHYGYEKSFFDLRFDGYLIHIDFACWHHEAMIYVVKVSEEIFTSSRE